MIVLSIVIAVLILISLLRFGVKAEYSAEGLTVRVKAGPLSFNAYPSQETPEKAQKKALRKEQKKQKEKKKAEKKAKKKPEEKKPGKVQTVLDMIPAVKKALSRLRRRLLIKKLTVYYVAAGEDAAKTALSFGAANAVIGVITPVLEDRFRIKRRDIRAFTDFQAVEQSIYIEASLSVAVWEAVYVLITFLPVLIKR